MDFVTPWNLPQHPARNEIQFDRELRRHRYSNNLHSPFARLFAVPFIDGFLAAWSAVVAPLLQPDPVFHKCGGPIRRPSEKSNRDGARSR